jgi:hypothetical protein
MMDAARRSTDIARIGASSRALAASVGSLALVIARQMGYAGGTGRGRPLNRRTITAVRSSIDVSPPRRPERAYRVYPGLIERCAALAPIATAVAHPCDESSQGAIGAAHAGLIRPILVGPEAKIRAVAGQCGIDLAPYELVGAAHSHAAAAQAVAIVRAGEALALMKGSLFRPTLGPAGPAGRAAIA